MMKKLLLILTALLCVPMAYSAPSIKPYQKALMGLDIKEIELNGNHLLVTFNRDKIGEIMLRSVISDLCWETYLDKKFTKILDLKRVTITNKHYVRAFSFETDVKQYCKNISKLNDEEKKAQFPLERYIVEH